MYYLFDERGDTALRLNASRTILSAHVTADYGSVRTQDYGGDTSSATDPFAGLGAQYGYMREPGLDLYRCGLRFYDTVNARWLTRDPIEYEGGQNLYAYCNGNPVMGVDPFGLADTWEEWFGQFFSGWFANTPITPGTATLGNAAAANAATMRELMSGDDEGGMNSVMCATQNRLAPAGKQVRQFSDYAVGSTLIGAVTVRGVAGPTPPSSLGMGNASFGKMIGWGGTGAEARVRMGSITKSEIQSWREQGLTAELARQWSKWYRQIDRLSTNADYLLGNPAGRARLMRKIGSMLANDK